MSKILGGLKVVIGTESKALSAGLSQAKGKVASFASSIKGIKIPWAAMAAGVTAVGGSLVAAGAKGLKSWSVQEEAIVGLNNTLSTMGQSAVAHSTKLQEAAANIQSMTTYGDEVTLSFMRIGAAAGIPAEKLEESVKAAIGFKETLGVSVQKSLKAMGAALVGNTVKMKMFGMEGDKLATPAENYNKILARGVNLFGAATEKANSHSAMLTRINNNIGDMWESVGQFTQALLGSADVMRTLLDLSASISSKMAGGAVEQGTYWRAFLFEMKQGFMRYIWTPLEVIFNSTQKFLGGIMANFYQLFTWLGENWGKLWDNMGYLALAVINDIFDNSLRLMGALKDWMASGFTKPIDFEVSMDWTKMEKEGAGIETRALADIPLDFAKDWQEGFAKLDKEQEAERLAFITKSGTAMADAAAKLSGLDSKKATMLEPTAKDAEPEKEEPKKERSFAGAAIKGTADAYSTIIRSITRLKDGDAKATAAATKATANNTRLMVVQAEKQTEIINELIGMPVL